MLFPSLYFFYFLSRDIFSHSKKTATTQWCFIKEERAANQVATLKNSRNHVLSTCEVLYFGVFLHPHYVCASSLEARRKVLSLNCIAMFSLLTTRMVSRCFIYFTRLNTFVIRRALLCVLCDSLTSPSGFSLCHSLASAIVKLLALTLNVILFVKIGSSLPFVTLSLVLLCFGKLWHMFAPSC